MRKNAAKSSALVPTNAASFANVPERNGRLLGSYDDGNVAPGPSGSMLLEDATSDIDGFSFRRRRGDQRTGSHR